MPLQSFATSSKSEGPVVPHDLWDKVAAKLNDNGKRLAKPKTGGKTYYLSGILELPDGTKLTGASAKGGSKHYYESRKSKVRVSKEEIEKTVIARVKSLIRNRGFLERAAKQALSRKDTFSSELIDAIRKLKAQINALEKTDQRFSEMIREAARNSNSDFLSVMKTIEAEQRKAEAELSRAKAQLQESIAQLDFIEKNLNIEKIGKCLDRAFRNFDSDSDPRKMNLIQEMIPRIIIHSDRLEIFINSFNEKGPPRVSGGQTFVYNKNGSAVTSHLTH